MYRYLIFYKNVLQSQLFLLIYLAYQGYKHNLLQNDKFDSIFNIQSIIIISKRTMDIIKLEE